jgi:hypothetical protein
MAFLSICFKIIDFDHGFLKKFSVLSCQYPNLSNNQFTWDSDWLWLAMHTAKV